MGHYASEMDPDWNKGCDEIEAALAAGFSYHNRVSEFKVCEICSAVVLDWRKHRKVCKK